MRLVFLTQAVDAEHPALAQTLDVIAALAARVDELVVICQSVGPHSPLPENVRVREFGGRRRFVRGARFVALLGSELRRSPRPSAIVAHMIPLYVVLAAPLAKPLRVPLALWYTHWHASRSLRLAVRLGDVVLSVDRRSFPLDTPKLHPIGHAIDVELFSPGPRELRSGPLRLLALGRMARWKGYDTMLAALEKALGRGVDVELEIRGPQLTDDERAHHAELQARVESTPAFRGRVRIEPPVPRSELPARLARADALISATQPRGSETLDKVVYEAAACGVPVLASNTALDEFLGGLPLELRFPSQDAGVLAERLAELAAADETTVAEVGAELRRRVVAAHSVEHWADAVIAAVAGGAPE